MGLPALLSVRSAQSKLRLLFGGLVDYARTLIPSDDTQPTYRTYGFCVFDGLNEKKYTDLGNTLNELGFWMLVPLSSSQGEYSLIPLPAITSNPEVIAQLETMQRGQRFKILEESSWGAMGTRIDKIEILDGPLAGIQNPSTQQIAGSSGNTLSLK